jgi:hypothetical protein
MKRTFFAAVAAVALTGTAGASQTTYGLAFPAYAADGRYVGMATWSPTCRLPQVSGDIYRSNLVVDLAGYAPGTGATVLVTADGNPVAVMPAGCLK